MVINMKNLINEENIKRFDGFTEIYNNSRPVPPEIIVKILVKYLGKNPETAVDLGSGTGLSTGIWQGVAETVVGIEPNDDMRLEAAKNVQSSNITFRKGVSNDTGLPSDYADIITVSQAFHWMDIDSTLAEAFRVMKDGGVFAAYDCDWLPAVDWRVEAAYNELRRKCDKICSEKENPAVRNDKSTYIERFNRFGRFRFVKEVVCHSVENCDSARMKGIALSQGGVQSAMKLSDEIKGEVGAFCELVDSRCKGRFDIVFSYRVRLGVK